MIRLFLSVGINFNPLEFSVVDGMFKVIKVLFYRYIRDETEMTSAVTRNIGNVTKDTDITFEYGVRPQSSKSLVYLDYET